MAYPKKRFKIIAEYIAAFPKNVQTILEEMRQAIREAVLPLFEPKQPYPLQGPAMLSQEINLNFHENSKDL